MNYNRQFKAAQARIKKQIDKNADAALLEIKELILTSKQEINSLVISHVEK